MNQRSFVASRKRLVFACLAAAVFYGFSANAGVAYRFTGSIGEYRGGTRFNYDSFDRSDAGGQGFVHFDEFPPLASESRHMRATSSAGPGYLSASSHADFAKDYTSGGGFDESLSGSSYAGVTFDDVVISGPAGSMSTSINTHLSGLLIAGAQIQNNANSNVQVSFYYNGENVGGGYSSLSVYAGNSTLTQTGPLTGFNGSGVITSQSFVVATNVPVKIGIAFSTASNVATNFNIISTVFANSDFGSTLTLATDRPVFNLPPGYTVNSVQAGIVNNIYTPPCPGDLNHDSQVDDADFSVFVVGYNILDCADPAMTPGCPADLNSDGLVDDADFSKFVVAYDALLCP